MLISNVAREKALAGTSSRTSAKRSETAPPAAQDDGSYLFTISTTAIDRDGDTIQQVWELDHFRANPQVLWMHDRTHLPIGKVVEIGVVDGALKARVVLAVDVPETKASAIKALLDGGFLSATSVGFDILDYEVVDREDGRRGLNVLRSELLELSIVTVPANPEALIDRPAVSLATSPKSAQVDAGRARRIRIANAVARQ